MITFFRKLQDSFLVKILLGITMLSFMSFFGVSGYLSSAGGAKGPAIKVGNIEVSAQELDRELNREVKRFKMIYGDAFDRDKAISYGYLAEIVKRATSRAVVDMTAKDFGVSISDESVANTVKKLPDFQNHNGEFDKSMFDRMLYATNWSEQEYLNAIKGDIKRTHILKAASQNNSLPYELAKNIYKYRGEKRVAELVKINIDDIKIANKPSKEILEKYYEERKSMFMTPEYRKITYVMLVPSAIESQINVTDDEIKNIYQENKASYITPETRFVLQMVFDSKEKADKAKEKLNKGEDFYKVAKELAKQEKEDTDLGWVTKESMLPELGEAVFETAKNINIGALKSQFGWHLLKVKDIKKEVKVPFDTAKKQIKERLVKAKALDMLYEISTTLDDELGRGSKLEDAAEKIGLEVKTVENIDSTGTNSNGEKIEDIASNQIFLDTAFMTFFGEESQLTEFENGYFVLRVDDIKDPEPKTLEEVKNQLIKVWKNRRKEEVAREKAESVLADIIAGKNVKEVASKNNFEYEVSEPVTRFETEIVPPSAVAEIFQLKVSDAGMNITKEGFIVSKLKKIIEVNPDKNIAEVKALKEQMDKNYGSDLTTGLIAAFSKQHKIKINNEVLETYFKVNETNSEEGY